MSCSLMLRIAAGWALMTVAAFAQDYPAKPVRVVVPWAAGGSTDSIGRILAAKLTEYTGQQFIIDNRAGATGTIGHGLVSKSPPDGYTLLVGTNSTFAIAPHLYETLQYRQRCLVRTLIAVGSEPADPVGASFGSGEERKGTDRTGEGEPGRAHIFIRRAGQHESSRDRAFDEYDAEPE